MPAISSRLLDNRDFYSAGW